MQASVTCHWHDTVQQRLSDLDPPWWVLLADAGPLQRAAEPAFCLDVPRVRGRVCSTHILPAQPGDTVYLDGQM